MAPNKAVIFNEIPDGWPVAGKHLIVKDIGFDHDADAPADGITIEIAYCSFDPYQRGRMRAAETKGYFPSFTLHEPITNSAIGKVLKSNTSQFKPGDVIRGFFPFVEYAALTADQLKRGAEKIENPHGVDIKTFLGALGMPGITAYSSLYEIGKPKKGETIFISAASGAVGQIVGQLAKHEGLKVIGSVGSKEKLDFIKTIGFDGGFNYKEEKPADALKRLAPDGIDIYYENVGGEQLEAALDAANKWGRFIICGMISQYSARQGEKYGVKNLDLIIGKSLLLRGFLQADPDMAPKWNKERNENIGKWVADGSFKITMSETKGIENAPEGLIGMLRGDNFGKAILVVKELNS